MKTLRFLLLTSGMLIYHEASGQLSADQMVIGSAGKGEVVSSSISASWTAGETAIQTQASGTLTLTEGFHQTNVDDLSIETNAPDIDLKLYPNPTHDKVYLGVNATEAQKINYDLFTSLGQKVNLPESSMSVDGYTEKTLDFGHLNKGTYLLRVTSDKGVQLSTIRIIKN
ncbi:hypothetical protein CW751_05525 [Brumimicrobium salinarum]|uniref:Secretion system C-terminal sorting domain-containing protein n=1 Tax=Brumimicrobium salinarum TaxID=2058658 RepID=A0A2I0R4G1_9FLAO|nr:T9SS type A sorting domain-containing protein [Brumimicrobium salinarum]PKR81280.1 hypothetical protein CW751_05525 [Brumimicrobium salinarum]